MITIANATANQTFLFIIFLYFIKYKNSMWKKVALIVGSGIGIGFLLYLIFKPKPKQPPSGVGITYEVLSQGPPYIIVSEED